MSLLTIMLVMNSIKRAIYPILAAWLLAAPAAQAEWSIDLSRRTNQMRREEVRSTSEAPEQKSLLDVVFDAGETSHELVILNTDRGFVPATVRVREGLQYKIHVVNVNEQDRNVSFVMDAFSEHHATYYGKIRTFVIRPKKEGIYTFQSPETSAQGRLIVFPPLKSEDPSTVRAPANQ